MMNLIHKVRNLGSQLASPSSPSKKKSRKSHYSRFTQQELPAWKPILTPGWFITAFIIVGITFIPIGLASFFASARVVEIVDRYDEECLPSSQKDNPLGFIKSPKSNKTCIRHLTIPKKMRSPIYVYYQLDNYYQNHRRYVKSRSDKQLREHKSENEVSDCKPIDKKDNNPIVPCGLIAWSLFNDTYEFSVKKKSLQVDRRDIAWPSDKYHKFGDDVYPKNFQSGGLIGGGKLNESIPLREQEELIVWMRTATLPSFRKLYGRIDVDLEANDDVEVSIDNNYNTYEFEGTKTLVLSTNSWIGGKNDFLGRVYLGVGGTCLFVAMVLIVLYFVKPRPIGDPAYLSWNKNPHGRYN